MKGHLYVENRYYLCGMLGNYRLFLNFFAQNSRTLRSSYDQIVMEMDHVNIQLKAEQNRVLSLQNQLRMGEANQRRMVEMKEQIIDLQRETDTLKEANENLVGRLTVFYGSKL